jgi:hypothetical protein
VDAVSIESHNQLDRFTRCSQVLHLPRINVAYLARREPMRSIALQQEQSSSACLCAQDHKLKFGSIVLRR